MQFIASIGILALLTANSVLAQDSRTANDKHLERYTNSGGLAYYHSKDGSDRNGTELMVRRCNQPKLRVSTKPIFDMEGLSKLILHGVDFTDSELDGIGKMDDLPALLINGRITDNGIRHLAGLKSLKHLWIYQTKVNGDGLAHLKALEKLETLYFDSKMTDAAFKQLEQLKQLKELWIPDCPSNILKKLRLALPNTEITD